LVGVWPGSGLNVLGVVKVGGEPVEVARELTRSIGGEVGARERPVAVDDGYDDLERSGRNVRASQEVQPQNWVAPGCSGSGSVAVSRACANAVRGP
jgi:hypothetical protein